jgi:ABC-type uncharacterized transport system ATPase subunit
MLFLTYASVPRTTNSKVTVYFNGFETVSQLAQPTHHKGFRSCPGPEGAKKNRIA